jgi:hypothetical protein
MLDYISEKLAIDSDRDEYFNLLGAERTALGKYQDLKTEEITALCVFAIEEERASRPFQTDPAWADSWKEHRLARTGEWEVWIREPMNGSTIIKVEDPEETSKIAVDVPEEGKQATVEDEVETAKAVAADRKQDVEVGKEGKEQGLNPKRSRKRKNPSN